MVVSQRDGFAVVTAKNIYFMGSDKVRRSKSVIDAFITAMCKYRGFDSAFIDRALADENTRADIQDRMCAYHYELRECDNGLQYHSLNSDNCLMNFPLDDCDELIFLN